MHELTFPPLRQLLAQIVNEEQHSIQLHEKQLSDSLRRETALAQMIW